MNGRLRMIMNDNNGWQKRIKGWKWISSTSSLPDTESSKQAPAWEQGFSEHELAGAEQVGPVNPATQEQVVVCSGVGFNSGRHRPPFSHREVAQGFLPGGISVSKLQSYPRKDGFK